MSEWTPGERHPETPIWIFKNVWLTDRVRRVLIGRCKNCGFVISSKEEEVKELVFECKDPLCYCKKTLYSTKVHRVCSVCYDVWHSIYMNTVLKNMNYWKELDEKDEKEKQERNRKLRGGF